MAVLVAGVGYIGAALAARLLRDGERVVALDNGFSTDLAAVGKLAGLGDFHLVQGSVTSARSVRRAFARGPFEVVYHLAAQASAYYPPGLARYTELTNLGGPRRVFTAAIACAVPRIVYASSLRVYGPVLPAALDETAPYGVQRDLAHLSHVYGEKLLEMHTGDTATVGVAVRLAVVYGIGPVMKRDYRYLTAPNKFCLQAVRGEPLVVYAGAVTPTAFIHLDDACAAVQMAAAAPWSAGFHPANAAGEVCTVPEVAAAVLAEASRRGLRAEVRAQDSTGALDALCQARLQQPERDVATDRPTPTMRSEPPATPVPTVQIASRLHALGWRPARTLGDSVGTILDYFQAREAA